MTEPNNRDNEDIHLTYAYPVFQPFYPYFGLPQYSPYTLPTLNTYSLLKFNQPKSLTDLQPADNPEESHRFTTDIKIKSQPILVSSDEHVKIDPIQKIQVKVEQGAVILQCHCKKSHCLKQYCLCYKSGVACQDKCTCHGCKNTQDDLNQKLKPKLTKRIKCKCTKSKCSKKYCQCFSAKRKCEDFCQCTGCEN